MRPPKLLQPSPTTLTSKPVAPSGRVRTRADYAHVVGEARLEDTGAGLTPASEGWFVLNARDAVWLASDTFAAAGVFESEAARFQLGHTIAVLQPGEPSGLYHRESTQEDFLVLTGECLLLVEGEERRLKRWDFVHCPGGTEHIFVGAGDGPCVLFMVGARSADRSIVYPRSELALRHRAGAHAETPVSAEAYAPYSRWQPALIDHAGLPWA
jgi:uncharacterized cupin superfamily protein